MSVPHTKPNRGKKRSELTGGTLVIPSPTPRVNPPVPLGLAPDVLAERLRRPELRAAMAAGERHERRDALAARRAGGDHHAPTVRALGRNRRRCTGHESAAPPAAQAEAAAVAQLATAVVGGSHGPDCLTRSGVGGLIGRIEQMAVTLHTDDEGALPAYSVAGDDARRLAGAK